MASEQQLAALWGTLSHAVEESIRRTGGFTPVGAALHRDGRVEAFVAASSTDAEALLDQETRRRVLAGCVATVRATQVAARVAEAPTPVTGILLRFDNDAGVSRANFLAYTLAAGRIGYGELHGQEGAHDLFAPRGH